MKIFTLLLLGLLIIGCKKKDPPKPPQAALLVFPEPNSECTTGISLNESTSQVEFKWVAAQNTENYELRVTNNSTNTTQTITTQALSATLPITKGTIFSWMVLTKNSQVGQSAPSETWRFYNAGSLATHPPFPPEILAPELAESVFKDINNEVTLDWRGVDIDNDIVGYDLYFSIETPPETLIASPAANNTVLKVSVSSNTKYYWRVIARDQEGNTSNSGVFDFKVL